MADSETSIAVVSDRLELLLSLGSRIAAAETDRDVLQLIVKEGPRLSGASAAVVGVVDGDVIRIEAEVGYPPGYLDTWQTFPFVPGTPMSDVIAGEGAVFCSSREERNEKWPAFRDTGSSGSDAFAVLPLSARQGVIGAVSLSFQEQRTFLKEERLFLETFAGFCALALERTRAYASERVAHGRTERLQRYTARLAPALTVADVGEIAVNKALVASGGATSLLALETADGRHLEIRHVEGRPAPQRGSVRRFSRDDPSVVGEVFRTERPLWLHNREEWERFEEAIGRPLPLQSVAVIPVATGGHLFGVLGIAFDHERSFPEDEQSFLLAIAGQTAQALDRARLYEEQSEIAHVLQHSLIPQTLPQLPGCEIRASYRAAGRANETGGDFYDLFRAGDRHMLVVGDVCGKGPRAAALTSLCRYTLRAAALQAETAEPALLLDLLNRAILEQSSTDSEFASALCVALSPAAGGLAVTIATAGHPPALVRRAGGLIETHSRPGPIVGVFPTAEFVETALVLAPGDLLVVHTDGLTDARLADGNRIGEARIHELLASLQTPGPAAAINALEALLDLSQITDDVAIVAVAPS
jgi:serine phosphatase RsbU (regulator of sigma subunit)